VVVDNSSRLDAASRLVANLSECVLLVACTDVASLWSAARVQQYLGETGNRERLRLVLNRFRKVPGFSEADAENAAGVKLLWRVPNQYFAISSAIDRGSPVMEQSHTEIARCFSGLAQELTRNDVDVKRAPGVGRVYLRCGLGCGLKVKIVYKIFLWLICRPSSTASTSR
jgi:Flp pilus assembly CpaE family ATPase